LHVRLPFAGTGQFKQLGPQLAVDSLTHVPLQICMPLGQTQPPHWHEVVSQVSVPVPFAQDCCAPGAHGPSPVHADHAPVLPSLLHARVCVPRLQLPHDWVRGPQAHAPFTQLELEAQE